MIYRRSFALALVLCLVLSLMPVPAFAEEGETGQFLVTGQTEDVAYAEADGGEDNEELLDRYVQGLIDASLGQSLRRRSSVGAGLSGMDRIVYDILKTAAGEIAAGYRDSSVIVIDEDMLAENQFSCGPWTAAELGVEAVVANGQITQAAQNAGAARLSFDLGSVIRALLADCPAQLYWYDKTKANGTQSSISRSFDAKMTDGEWRISIHPVITITMAVSAGYQAGENTVDASRAVAAQTAINNAVRIAGNAAGTVREKLEYFKDTICGMVSYNSAAGTSYGDPWQLIYVFDDDPATNVVCEGYSKAFQYLFDLAELPYPYDCILVTGNMTGGTGAGAHMWNLVSLDDGRYYLVDVTNCDDGTAGAPYTLFLAACKSGSVDGGYVFRANNSDISYTYDNTTRLNYSDEMLTVPAADAQGIVTLYATADAGNIEISPKGVLRYGDKVTLTAQAVIGYEFDGWYDGNVEVCDGLAYTFRIDSDIQDLRARYTSDGEAYVRLSIINGNSFSFSGNVIESNNGTLKVKLGTELTLIAANADGEVQWQNAGQKLLGRDTTLRFVVVRNMDIVLVYPSDSSRSYVQFISDYGQVIQAGTYGTESDISLPSPPTKLGYSFLGWVFEDNGEPATADSIRARIGGNTISIRPQYEKDNTVYTVTVTYPDIDKEKDVYGNISVGSLYSVTAPKINGKTFLYWKIGDKIVSYKQRYYLQVDGYITLKAVYDDNAAAEILPVISMSDLRRVEGGIHKITGSATRSIPNGYTLIEHGILYAKDFSDPSAENFVYNNDAVNKYISGMTMENGVVKLNVNVSNEPDSDSTVVTMRGYMILMNDSTGHREMYYSEIVSGSYDNIAQ